MSAPLAMLLVTAFLFRASQNAAQTTLSLLGRQAHGLSVPAVGLVSALVGLLAALSTVVVGRVVPAAAVRRVLVGGLVVATAGFPALALAPDMALYLAGAVLLGLGGGIVFPCLTTAVGQRADARRDRDLATLALALSASLTVGPLAEAALLSMPGGSPGTALAAFTAVSSLAVLSAQGARRAGRRARRPDEPLEIALADTAAPTPGDAVEPDLGARSWSPWRDRRWRLALSAQLMYQVPFLGVVVYGVLVARSVYGLSGSEAQLGFTAFFACSLGSRALVAWASPVRAKRLVLLASALVTVCGVALLGAGAGTWAYFVAMATLGVPHGLTYPLALASVADAAPGHALARANAALGATSSVVGVVVPVVLGQLAAHLGERAMVLSMLVPVVLMTGVLASGGARGRSVLARVRRSSRGADWCEAGPRGGVPTAASQ